MENIFAEGEEDRERSRLHSCLHEPPALWEGLGSIIGEGKRAVVLLPMLFLVYGMGVEPGLSVATGIAVGPGVDPNTKPFS